MKKIIAFQGDIGAGKDTCAEIAAGILYLNKENPALLLKRSFANKLKRMISVLTGIEMVEIDSPFYSEPYLDFTREQKGMVLPIYNMTLGRLLQVFATEVCRDSFREDIWIVGLDSDINPNAVNFITDMRFLNEFGYLQNPESLVVRINRKDNPFDISDSRPREHKSESQLSKLRDRDFDEVIDNDSDLESLFRQIESMLKLHGFLNKDSNITQWEAEKILNYFQKEIQS